MPAFELPRTLTLPSGRRFTLRRDATRPVITRRRHEHAPLFSEVFALFDAEVILAEEPRTKTRSPSPLDELPPTSKSLHDLSLADFHVLRAFLSKSRLVHEDEVDIECHNCGVLIAVRPCEGLEAGPWEDGELDDPELDHTAPFGVPLAVRALPLGRVREARTVTFEPRTVGDALPLFAALAKDPLEIEAAFVHGMGLAAIGDIVDPRRIVEILRACDDAAFEAITDAFLESHYPLRLACDVFCSACKARNTVDAPYEREFEFGLRLRADESNAASGTCIEAPLPPLEAFVEIAHAIAEPLLAQLPGERVELIVADGTPDVDDGGEPLLGSYVPPPPRDAPVPATAPTVTIYYQTFAAIERTGSDPPFDWEAELRETIEHELEHHIFFLRGDDPMDEEEHAEIDREAVRVVGRGETNRRAVATFGHSIPDFLTRAWPLVAIAAAVLAITLAQGRCGAPE